MPLTVRSIMEILRYYTASSTQTMETQDSVVILDQCSIKKCAAHWSIKETYWSVSSLLFCITQAHKMSSAAKILMSVSHVCLKCTYFIFVHVLQICPRTVSQRSLLKCVCLPPSSHSTSTTTASSASQKPLSICRCWLILISGGLLLTSHCGQFAFACIFFSKCDCVQCSCSPFTSLTGQKHSHEREVSSFAETHFPNTRCYMHIIWHRK